MEKCFRVPGWAWNEDVTVVAAAVVVEGWERVGRDAAGLRVRADRERDNSESAGAADAREGSSRESGGRRNMTVE